MSFQNQALNAPNAVTSTTQFVANQPTQTGFGTPTQGLLVLPRGEIVHILPTAPVHQPYALAAFPAAALFSAVVVGALLQSQNRYHQDVEKPIAEPVLLLTNKVIRVEWPESSNREQQQRPDQGKAKKKKKGKKSEDPNYKFDGNCFFYSVYLPLKEAELDLENIEIIPISEKLSGNVRRLASLRKATTIALSDIE